MTSRQEVALLRLVAQRIAGPGWASAGEAVGWATASQGQDLPGALESIVLRTASGSPADAVAALDSGEVVRSWPMRGTLHLVRGEDLGWILGLTAERTVAAAARRRAQLGIDDAILARARSVAVEALTGGGRMTRQELRSAWEAAGLPTEGQRAYHLIWHLAQTGTLCWGPLVGAEQQLVLLEEWVAAPRRPAREEALAELARRYFRSHGPATVADFLWWTKLRAAEGRAGVAIARADLEVLVTDGVEMLMDPATPDLLAAHRASARGTFLLPGFDEYLLGYQDRSAALPPEFAERIVPGANGVFRRTVVDAGTVVGTWRWTTRGKRREVSATPFVAFTRRAEGAIARRSAAASGADAGR